MIKYLKILSSNFKPKNSYSTMDEHAFVIFNKISKKDVNIIFDIGAHQGRFISTALKWHKNSHIYAFEPFPNSFELLKANASFPNITLENIAISNSEGNKKFYSNELDETNSLLLSTETGSNIDKLTKTKEIIEVPSTSLDNYCKKHSIKVIDVLKIDVQGSSYEVLLGAKELLKTNNIKLIQCEIEFIEIYKNQKLFHDVASFLSNYGYYLYSLYNLNYSINERLSWADAIFICD